MRIPAPRSGAKRLAAAVGAGALVVVPFLAVSFPPITDLAQHVAQVRLFGEALHDAASPYTIQWLTPYGLCYVVLGLAWALVEPLAAGRLGAAALAVLWVMAIHLVAWRRGRSAAGAVLASALVFNHTLYWGFLNFVAGWPVFLVWLLVTLDRGRRQWDWRHGLALLAAACGLYFAHALWLAMGLLWLAASGVLRRLPLRFQMARALAVAPVALLAAVSFLRLRQGGFVSETVWAVLPWARLAPTAAREALLGGLWGGSEPLLLAALVAWLGVGYLTRRGHYREAVDGGLLAAGGLLFAVSFALPDKYMNTIEFWQRWWPHAAVLAVLALPPPRLSPVLRLAAAAAVVVPFTLHTAVLWRVFERQELAGLRETLAALPPAPRVLGLDYVRRSSVVRGSPFLQVFAYAQVARGGALNFTFAEFAPSLVVYDPPRRRPWTRLLEWFPYSVRRSDFQHFDRVIVHGDEATHQVMGSRAGLVPITGTGRWRLYGIPAAPD